MQDHPSKLELLRAVECFLEDDAVVHLADPEKFRARVSLNVVRMIMREIETEAGALAAEHGELSALLGEAQDEENPGEMAAQEVLEMNEILAHRIRRGEADAGPFRRAVIAHLRGIAVRKLDVANPALADRIRIEWGWEKGTTGPPAASAVSSRRTYP